MRITQTFFASLFLLLAACGQTAAPSDADAQTNVATSAMQSGEVTAAERAAILAALNMRANASGQVENECGDMVTPQFIAVDLGAGVGRAVVFMIGGGQSIASCYGDGPLTVIYRNTGGAWRDIYQQRGGTPAILPAQHNGGNDLAAGGPGFSFPVWQWNGATYEFANREVPDSALGDARFIQ
ncbi:MAG: hypothetical protein AB7H66_07710 [Hyphomonadaceae bacterium]